MKLKLWNSYTREQVHSIFSPDTVFTPQAGTWGLQGMVRIPDRVGDWVFFVTFGQQQGEHLFDESITEDGVLSWQSQPRLGLGSDIIESLINHDDRVNNIHLFLRDNKKERNYGYFGTLGYLTHDTEREKPVHFQWQILEWSAPQSFLNTIGITLTGHSVQPPTLSNETRHPELVFVPTPEPKTRRSGTTTKDFKANKRPNYAVNEANNKKLGLVGEKLVLIAEIKSLTEANRSDLAEKVVHVSVVEGDGAGYDILSFDKNGQEKYIEVKTTKCPATTDFFISPNELEFSTQHAESYSLYRVFEYDLESASAKVYVLEGDLSTQLCLQPTQYKAQLAK